MKEWKISGRAHTSRKTRRNKYDGRQAAFMEQTEHIEGGGGKELGSLEKEKGVLGRRERKKGEGERERGKREKERGD